jgi:biotin carboxylase
MKYGTCCKQGRNSRKDNTHLQKKIGLKTIAVYSESDEGSMHTRLADESVMHRPEAGREELS